MPVRVDAVTFTRGHARAGSPAWVAFVVIGALTRGQWLHRARPRLEGHHGVAGSGIRFASGLAAPTAGAIAMTSTLALNTPKTRLISTNRSQRKLRTFRPRGRPPRRGVALPGRPDGQSRETPSKLGPDAGADDPPIAGDVQSLLPGASQGAFVPCCTFNRSRKLAHH